MMPGLDRSLTVTAGDSGSRWRRASGRKGQNIASGKNMNSARGRVGPELRHRLDDAVL